MLGKPHETHPRAPAATAARGSSLFHDRAEDDVDTSTPNQSPDRKPIPEAEVRSALLRLLRLLAAEVARRLPAPNDPGRDRHPRDACTIQVGFPIERVPSRAAGPEGRP